MTQERITELDAKMSRYKQLKSMRESLNIKENQFLTAVGQHNELASELGEKPFVIDRDTLKSAALAQDLSGDITVLCRRPQSMNDLVAQLAPLHSDNTIRHRVRALLGNKKLYKIGSRGKNVQYMVRVEMAEQQ